MRLQLDRLERMASFGMGLAEEIARRAALPHGQGQVSADELCGLSLAYTRVSRAVRQIIALEQEVMGLRAMRDRSAPVNMPRKAQEDDRALLTDDEDDGDLVENIDDLRDTMSDLEDLLDRYDLDDYDDLDDGSAEELTERIQAALERIQAKMPARDEDDEDDEDDFDDVESSEASSDETQQDPN